MAGTHLTFTNGTPTNNAKFTISVWSKRSGLASSDYMNIMNSRQTSSTSGLGLWWGNDSFYYNFGTGTTGTAYCQSTAKYRDVNGWYHMVVAGDTTQSGTDKLKFWINGEQITSFSNDQRSSFVGLDYDIGNTNYPILIGMKHNGTYYYDGLLSHLHFIDGTAYTPSAFGSTDSTTGEWKINAGPNVTYGNNGFFILKDGNSVTDQSGNSNNFTVAGGTLTKTEDCPSDIFCTYNRGHYLGTSHTLSNGNTVQKETSDVGQRQVIGTLGAAKGKYYAEFKLANVGSNVGGSYPYVGCVNINNYTYNTYLGNNGIAMHPGGNIYRSASVIDSQTSITYTTGDIVSVALDVDNLKAHFRVNGGTWLASGDPANNTGGYDISSFITENENFLTFASSVYNNNGEWNTNFGNGYFKTTAVSSAGTNASEIGIFEYDVPSGFTALSTKGLNSF